MCQLTTQSCLNVRFYLNTKQIGSPIQSHLTGIDTDPQVSPKPFKGVRFARQSGIRDGHC